MKLNLNSELPVRQSTTLINLIAFNSICRDNNTMSSARVVAWVLQLIASGTFLRLKAEIKDKQKCYVVSSPSEFCNEIPLLFQKLYMIRRRSDEALLAGTCTKIVI